MSQAIFLYTRGHGCTKVFQNPDGRETTLAIGHQDNNKNTYEANILCSLIFKVFQKYTLFSHKTFVTTIAECPVYEMALPNCPRPYYECQGHTRKDQNINISL